jgi:hypothetical protein
MYLEGVHAFRATCAPSLSEQALPFMTALKASHHLFFLLLFVQQHRAQACYLL